MLTFARHVSKLPDYKGPHIGTDVKNAIKDHKLFATSLIEEDPNNPSQQDVEVVRTQLIYFLFVF